MSKIWSDERKFQIWLEIEVLACEAMAELGQIPKRDAADIRKRARFSIPEILEIEKRTNHDVIAFLENVAGAVGPAARWIHQGLTSSDILDTTLAVQLNESCEILLVDLKSLRTVIADQARRYKMTPMIGRSHGVHAEPITFGVKLALMYDEFGRGQERLTQTRERIRVGKISGAVGTHAHIDPKIERAVCERLGLKPAMLSTQIVQRDRHAEFMTTLAVIASSIDRWATEFRHLQRTEVLEVEEFFGEGQKGSSAMPHKRNPITSERLSGLARVVRGNAIVALEDVALWHERDICRKCKAGARNHNLALRFRHRTSLLARHSFQTYRCYIQSAWLGLTWLPEAWSARFLARSGSHLSVVRNTMIRRKRSAILLRASGSGRNQSPAATAASLNAFLPTILLASIPRGGMYGKAKMVSETRDAPKYFASNHVNEVKVRFYSDTAVAQGNESWERHNGERGRFVWTDTWLWRHGRWQIVAAEDLIAPESSR